MSRPLRIQYENALYHVTSRGNGRSPIFLDDEDRCAFIEILAKVVEQYTLVIYAYCLMGNHYHLLVRTPKANLSTGMRQLNGLYAQYFNRRHEKVGHLFQGRFSAILIKDEDRLLTVARYVVLNPVRAGLTDKPEKWRWSSYRGTAGINEPPSFIDADQVLCHFSEKRKLACRQYIEFVNNGYEEDSPLANAKGGIIARGKGVVEVTAARLMGEISREVPNRERFADRPELEEIFADNDRDIGIYYAYRKHGYKLREIGEFLGLHYSVVSKIAHKVEKKK